MINASTTRPDFYLHALPAGDNSLLYDYLTGHTCGKVTCVCACLLANFSTIQLCSIIVQLYFPLVIHEILNKLRFSICKFFKLLKFIVIINYLIL